jgi:hypothetical protein
VLPGDDPNAVIRHHPNKGMALLQQRETIVEYGLG